MFKNDVDIAANPAALNENLRGNVSDRSVWHQVHELRDATKYRSPLTLAPGKVARQKKIQTKKNQCN